MVRIPKKWQAEEFQPHGVSEGELGKTKVPEKWQGEEVQPKAADDPEEQAAIDQARLEAQAEAEQEMERQAKKSPSSTILKRLGELGMLGSIKASLREAGYEEADLEDEAQQEIIEQITTEANSEAVRASMRAAEQSAQEAKAILYRQESLQAISPSPEVATLLEKFERDTKDTKARIKRNEKKYASSIAAVLRRMRGEWKTDQETGEPIADQATSTPEPVTPIPDSTLATIQTETKAEAEPPPELKAGGWALITKTSGDKVPVRIATLSKTKARVEVSDGKYINMIRSSLEPTDAPPEAAPATPPSESRATPPPIPEKPAAAPPPENLDDVLADMGIIEPKAEPVEKEEEVPWWMKPLPAESAPELSAEDQRFITENANKYLDQTIKDLQGLDMHGKEQLRALMKAYKEKVAAGDFFSNTDIAYTQSGKRFTRQRESFYDQTIQQLAVMDRASVRNEKKYQDFRQLVETMKRDPKYKDHETKQRERIQAEDDKRRAEAAATAAEQAKDAPAPHIEDPAKQTKVHEVYKPDPQPKEPTGEAPEEDPVKEIRRVQEEREQIEQREAKERRELIEQLLEEGGVVMDSSILKKASPKKEWSGYENLFDDTNLAKGQVDARSSFANLSEIDKEYEKPWGKLPEAGVNEIVTLTKGPDIKHSQRVRGGKNEPLYELEYITIDDPQKAYRDYSGRTGNYMNVKLSLPESLAKSAIEKIKQDPSIMRELAAKAAKENMSISEADWENGTDTHLGYPIRPPFEEWAAKKDGKLRTYIHGPDDPTEFNPASITESEFTEKPTSLESNPLYKQYLTEAALDLLKTDEAARIAGTFSAEVSPNGYLLELDGSEGFIKPLNIVGEAGLQKARQAALDRLNSEMPDRTKMYEAA